MGRASDPKRAQKAATWIVQRLQDQGHVAYFAGGCVRDALLGLHPTDFDVATDATPQRVRSIFPRTAEVGAAFGVVLVYVAPEITGGDPRDKSQVVNVEVATFRSDGPYTDARRPDSVQFSDARSDAQRRDFTINALFLDPTDDPDEQTRALATRDIDGRVIDYVGGVRDLKAKVIRAVGDPDKRLAEDHLRALRAVRFSARLGFPIEEGTASAIRRHAGALRGVSRERIGEELRRMLAPASRGRAIELLQQLGLDAPVLDGPAHACPTPRVLGLPPKIQLSTCLAAWEVDRAVHARPDGPAWLSDPEVYRVVDRLRKALCLSNEESEDLKADLRSVRLLGHEWGSLGVAKRKRIASKSWYARGLEIVRGVDGLGVGRILADVQTYAGDGIGVDPTPLITGDDLVASGMRPGPRFRDILEHVRDEQLEGRVRTIEEAMELARKLNV